MTDLRPKGWTGDAWVIERLIEGGEAGSEFWAIWYISTVNPTAEYRGRPGFRVRRATLTMEE